MQSSTLLSGAYTFLFEHPKGSFLLQSSAGWKSGSLDGIQVDKVILGIGSLGSQTNEYQTTYFNELIEKVGANHIYLIHWDAFAGSIRQPIQGPSLFLDWYAGNTQKGFQAVENEIKKHPNLKVNLLPQWINIKL